MSYRKPIKPEVWLAVINRDGPHCRYCGKPCEDFGWFWPSKGRLRPWFREFVLDHYIPHVQGGTDAADNLVVACESCNKSKCHRDAPPLLPPKPFALGPPGPTKVIDYGGRSRWRG